MGQIGNPIRKWEVVPIPEPHEAPVREPEAPEPEKAPPEKEPVPA